jgi:hypothetical protein
VLHIPVWQGVLCPLDRWKPYQRTQFSGGRGNPPPTFAWAKAVQTTPLPARPLNWVVRPTSNGARLSIPYHRGAIHVENIDAAVSQNAWLAT